MQTPCRYLEEPEIYPFSHGLSYTTFEYRGLELLAGPNNNEDANSFVVRVEVHNTGQASPDPTQPPPPSPPPLLPCTPSSQRLPLRQGTSVHSAQEEAAFWLGGA